MPKRTRASTRTSTHTSTRTAQHRQRPTKQESGLQASTIHASFSTYSLPRSSLTYDEQQTLDSTSDDEDDGDDDGDADADREISDASYIRTADVHKALNALDLPRPPPDFFDDDQLVVTWRHFRMLAQALAEGGGGDHNNDDDDDDDVDDEREVGDGEETAQESEGDGDAYGEVDAKPSKSAKKGGSAASKPKSPPAPAKRKGRKGKQAATAPPTSSSDIDSAFSLFTTGSCITLADLRRIARELKEDIDERTLVAMIEEANGEKGRESVGRGVERSDFENVLRRAGVFG